LILSVLNHSGTEANLMALSAARAITRRTKVLVFDGAYHGGVFFFAGGAVRLTRHLNLLCGV